MAYEPRERKIKPIWIISAAIVFLVLLVGIIFRPTPKEEVQSFSIGKLSHEESVNKLSKHYDNTYVMSDYLFFGESLNMLKDTYNVENTDEVSGKSLILKDLLSKEERAYVLGSTIDRQVLFNRLESGYYEIYVIENLVEKRVVFNEATQDTLKTIVRDGKRYQVSLIADKQYFQKQNVDMDANYAFLEVKETTLDKDEYDIVLDPAAYDYDFTYVLNKGHEGNGLVEYKETYRACLMLKEKLEEYGLKVLVARDENEEVDSYGKNGRLHRGYKAKAKYYFRVSFSEDAYDSSGFDITYSMHSSDYLASQIAFHLTRLSDVKICETYGKNGVIQSSALEGSLDHRFVYDADLWIRESGGKATQAGMYSKNAQEQTAFFAKDNLYGMQGFNMTLGYLSNKDDASYWKKHQEEYMDALAKAIAFSLNVVKE